MGPVAGSPGPGRPTAWSPTVEVVVVRSGASAPGAGHRAHRGRADGFGPGVLARPLGRRLPGPRAAPSRGRTGSSASEHRRAARRGRRGAAGAVFESLADPTRRTVLRAVAEDGPLTATELAARLPVSRQAVAKHLDVLRSAGLVTSARDGRDVRFSFDARPLDDAMGWIAAVGARWDRRLAALRDRLDGCRAGAPGWPGGRRGTAQPPG